LARPMTAAEWVAAMRKWGVQLRLFPGYATRTRPGKNSDKRGLVIHHTGSDAQSESYDDWLFTEGRASEGIPAPLANATIDFDGDFHLGAIGRANHAGKGSSATLTKVSNESYDGYADEINPGSDAIDGNASYYGFEVKFDGGQPMTDKQYRTAVLAAAAICDFHGWSALSVIGHREHTRRKDDPGHTSMAKFRRDVRDALLAGPPGSKPSKPVDEKITIATRAIVEAAGGHAMNLTDSFYADAHWFVAWGRELDAFAPAFEDAWVKAVREKRYADAGSYFRYVVRCLETKFRLPVTGVPSTTLLRRMQPYGYVLIDYNGRTIQ
jgi:hypothetical protein